MRKDDKLDEWLYRTMPSVQEKRFDEIPDAPDLPFEPSECYQKKMEKLIRQAGRRERYQDNIKTVARLAVAVIMIGMFLTGVTSLLPSIEQQRLSAQANALTNFAQGDVMYEVAELGAGSITISRNAGKVEVKSWCYGCGKNCVNETHRVLIKGSGKTVSEANIDFCRNLQLHKEIYAGHLHSLDIEQTEE